MLMRIEWYLRAFIGKKKTLPMIFEFTTKLKEFIAPALENYEQVGLLANERHL